MVRQYEYQPCIPTRGTEVPAGPDWFHEVKHDGYRLIVHREGKRVRLLTRRGYDWSDRYPPRHRSRPQAPQKLIRH
jgi:bifunctional non-homologous end joining protein LigD